MTLSDGAIVRLRDAVERPDLPPRYEPIDVIGRGGMGVVWRARDTALDRDVAVKVIASEVSAGDLATRLGREAHILARLEHPGIVPVHDIGVLEDGRTWCVMRLVRGNPLDVAARDTRTRGELLRIVARVCDTVAYAHAHGVVHRDLKPGNVMLGPFGEVLVLDWGVARERVAGGGGRVAGAADPARYPLPATRDPVTEAGTVIGTPGYMSPEQAAGSEADERSDVYGIGAILRELLRVHSDPVARPLAAIRDRATAGDPMMRYATPADLGNDVRRFLDGARVLAYRESFVEAAARFARRHRVAILLVLAYLVARIGVLVWRGI